MIRGTSVKAPGGPMDASDTRSVSHVKLGQGL